MKVLVLGVASVQMDAVVELKKFGCETYTIAMAKDGPAADVADHFDIINILDEESVVKHILDNNIDVVRRLTGGRALLHDDEITYSFVCPTNYLKHGENVIKSYIEISQILTDKFKKLGIDLTTEPAKK